MSLQSAPVSSASPIYTGSPISTEQRRLVTSSALTHSPSFPLLRATSAWIHAWFVVLLLAVDLLAALWPTGGESLRSELAKVPGLDLRIDLPKLLLAGMLFNAGLALRSQHFFQVTQRPLLLILGTLSCWAIPFAVLFALIKPLSGFLPEAYRGDVWTGLMIIAAMPAAQSSMAWTQNARGNVLLCLIIVLGSTLFCPLVIPLVIQSVSAKEVSQEISWLHLLAWVIVPSLLGGIVGRAIGAARLDHWRPVLSLASAFMLLTLNYINAADALPRLLDKMEWATFALTLAFALALCAGSFAIAILGARLTKLPTPERTGLIYALGMKNNAIALTLTSGMPNDFPLVGLVLICYIVLQHLMAGLLSQHRQRQHALIGE